MPRPCEKLHALDPKGCRLCWLAANEPRYRKMWGIASALAPCPELGPPLTPPRLKKLGLDAERCGCLGVVRECGIHDQCTTGDPRNGIQCCLTCPDRPANGESNLIWSYGVTTCPMRKDDLLPRTLASLKAGGFDNPHLFVDGADDGLAWKRQFNLDVTARHPAVMVAKHWVLSLYELYCRLPHADLFTVFQDDFLCYANLRRYIERSVRPARGYLNIYTFPSAHKMASAQGLLRYAGQTGRYETGWFEAPAMLGEPLYEGGIAPQLGRSAIGLIFPRAAVIDLLTSRHLTERPQDTARGHRKIDGGVVAAMNKAGWKEYCHYPSLTQHLGVVSSIRNSPQAEADSWRGDYDALELLKEVNLTTEAV